MKKVEKLLLVFITILFIGVLFATTSNAYKQGEPAVKLNNIEIKDKETFVIGEKLYLNLDYTGKVEFATISFSGDNGKFLVSIKDLTGTPYIDLSSFGGQEVGAGKYTLEGIFFNPDNEENSVMYTKNNSENAYKLNYDISFNLIFNEEVYNMEKFLNENIGFLSSQYETIEKIADEGEYLGITQGGLGELLHLYLGQITFEVTNEEEKKAIEGAILGIPKDSEDTSLVGFRMPVLKVEKEVAVKLFKDNTTMTEKEIVELLNSEKSGLYYNEKNDSYYYCKSDAALFDGAKLEIQSASTVDDGIYEVAYIINDAVDGRDYSGVVVLKENGDTLKFISNKYWNSLDEYYASITGDVDEPLDSKNNTLQQDNKVQNVNKDNNNAIKNTDNTVSSNILPKTGENWILPIVILLAIMVFVGVTFYFHKKK